MKLFVMSALLAISGAVALNLFDDREQKYLGPLSELGPFNRFGGRQYYPDVVDQIASRQLYGSNIGYPYGYSGILQNNLYGPLRKFQPGYLLRNVGK